MSRREDIKTAGSQDLLDLFYAFLPDLLSFLIYFQLFPPRRLHKFFGIFFPLPCFDGFSITPFPTSDRLSVVAIVCSMVSGLPFWRTSWWLFTLEFQFCSKQAVQCQLAPGFSVFHSVHLQGNWTVTFFSFSSLVVTQKMEKGSETSAWSIYAV